MYEKATLRYFLEYGWIVVNQNLFIKLSHKNITHFKLKKKDNYQDCQYYFNSYGDICIRIDDLEFALSKSYGYDIAF